MQAREPAGASNSHGALHHISSESIKELMEVSSLLLQLAVLVQCAVSTVAFKSHFACRFFLHDGIAESQRQCYKEANLCP